MRTEVSIYRALANLWQVLIPLVALCMLKVGLTPDKHRDLIYLVIFGAIINTIVGAARVPYTLAFGKVIAANQVMGVFTAWLIGNMIVTALIVLLLLRHLTPRVRESKFFVRYYWE